MLGLALTSAALQCCLLAGNAVADNILFVGNSFTYAAGTPVQRYKPRSITGRDPRSLGPQECAGRELGITALQIGALEQIAADQLAASGTALAPLALAKPAEPAGCAALD